ncbi:uncharacterized protein LOC110934035 [Helianthus annuus]|uniref:uncharacterized protein LOC110934035 n=1 Tax=Helianthus annuus TaxID=4232 RepID=UPI000B8F06B1|nr:uncharacterized protein LOC110934035 [Helianthus annuus]
MANDFNCFIEEVNLQEYTMRGNKFTFLAGTGNDCKMSKIDHVLVCQEFFNRWPGACLRALSRELSDHCPLVLSVYDSNFGAKPFKWFNSWLDKDSCEQVVVEALHGFSGSGPADVRLHKKLGAVRNGLRKWWKEISKKEEDALILWRLEISRNGARASYGDSGFRRGRSLVLEESKKELEKNLYLKNRDLHQKSRVKWASLGDENSGFFHRCIKGRRAANAIPGLLVDGSWVSKPALVSEESIGNLIAPFSKEEVKAVTSVKIDPFQKSDPFLKSGY